MSQDPHIPDWAVPGPAPAAAVKTADLRRQQDQHATRLTYIPPGGITFSELSDASKALLATLSTQAVSYGNLAGEGPNVDKQLYIRTDDGDGGASTGMWQYEGGAFVRIGPPAKHASQHNAGGSDAMTIDAAAATGSLRTLGTGSAQAAPGNDSRFASTAALTADMTAISAQTTLQNITGLGMSVGSSTTEIWRVKYWILALAANITMDIKFGFTVPASCLMRGGPIIGNNAAVVGWATLPAATTAAAIPTQATVITFGTGANVTQGFLMEYLVLGGGTPGVVQIQYAQNTSDAGTLQILKGSGMEAHKLAA